MNDKVTISIFELAKMFPDQQSAQDYLESRMWPDGTVCPHCKGSDRITTRKNGYYRCNPCKKDFTVRTGTIFERSHIPLHKWIYAMYLLVTARKGISSIQLSKELDITQKSAWFLLQRLREACGNDIGKLRGMVEVDETYVGGKEYNKHSSKKIKSGTGFVGKKPVIGMRERGGRMKSVKVDKVDTETLNKTITENIERGSTIHTDEHAGYRQLNDMSYTHETISHGKNEYVRGRVTTNGIESAFAVLKRGIHGVYHHTSEKHLDRYVDEFAFRLNEGNVKRHTLDRIDSLVDFTIGRHITYKELIQ